MANSAAVLRRVACSLVPVNDRPLTDLATPNAVSTTTAARLRKRKQRERDAAGDARGQTLCGFPWNPACRLAAGGLGALGKQARMPVTGRAPCWLCDAPSTRMCVCGADFAMTTRELELTSLVRFVRSSKTPVYAETDPEDQYEFLKMVHHYLGTAAENPWHGLARFCTVAAFSGSPANVGALEVGLRLDASDEDFLEVLDKHVLAGKKFWRGGQAHGRLAKTELVPSMARVCAQHMSDLGRLLREWHESEVDARPQATLAYLTRVNAVAAELKGGHYFAKRNMELVVIVGAASRQAFSFRVVDLDRVANVWPVGPGTEKGLKKIWPALRGQGQLRQALRVVQRALGSGAAKVPLVRISAFICFWMRQLDGTLSWERGEHVFRPLRKPRALGASASCSEHRWWRDVSQGAYTSSASFRQIAASRRAADSYQNP